MDLLEQIKNAQQSGMPISNTQVTSPSSLTNPPASTSSGSSTKKKTTSSSSSSTTVTAPAVTSPMDVLESITSGIESGTPVSNTLFNPETSPGVTIVNEPIEEVKPKTSNGVLDIITQTATGLSTSTVTTPIVTTNPLLLGLQVGEKAATGEIGIVAPQTEYYKSFGYKPSDVDYAKIYGDINAKINEQQNLLTEQQNLQLQYAGNVTVAQDVLRQQ